MKAMVLSAATLCLMVTAQADFVSQTWQSKLLYANVPFGSPSGSGVEGVGWQVDIALYGSSGLRLSLIEHAGTSEMLGWYDGAGYYVGGFQFDAYEGQTVVMRIFNAASRVMATHWLDSQPLTLPDLPSGSSPGATDGTFDFTGSFWAPDPFPAWPLHVHTEYGTPDNYEIEFNEWVCVIDSPVVEGGAKFMCAGWVGTGDAPAAGTTTNTGPFTISQESSITWLWEAFEYWLDVSVVGRGSLSMPNGWYSRGTNLTISAMPADGWFFTGWGDQISNDGPTAVTNLLMDTAQSLIARFGREGDLDGDEIEDAWELEHFSTIEACGATDDPDGDLYVNIEEFRNGTNPNVWDIHLERKPAIELIWRLVPGVNYQTQFKNDLTTNVWNNLGDVIVGDGSTNSVLDSTQGSETKYYRVITVP